MAKIRKPMRLDEDLVALVEKHGKGNNFTAKMEYILDDYFNTIPEKELRIKELDRRIDEKIKEFNKWTDKVNRFYKKFRNLINEINNC